MSLSPQPTVVEADAPVLNERQAIYRFAVGPALAADNPYLRLFHAALAREGIAVTGPLRMTQAWLAAEAPQLDGLHFHWPEELWRKTPSKLLKLTGGHAVRQLRPAARMLGVRFQLLRLRRYFRRARDLGIRVVWTLHNIEPHEGASTIDERGYRLLAQHCDLILCHSESARQQCIARYRPRGRVTVMPLGNYDGVYPNPRPRAQVLAELGFDASGALVTCLGRIRHYKGLDLACDAVAGCKGIQLLIAGTVQRGFDIERLRRRAAGSDRIRLIERHVSDQEFSDYSAASDAILLPYRKITGSAALLASWTLGRGVIASDLDYFREMLDRDSQAGVLFKSGDPEALTTAIQRYLTVPAEQRCAAARRMADRYTWDQCVRPVVQTMQAWSPRKRFACSNNERHLTEGT